MRFASTPKWYHVYFIDNGPEDSGTPQNQIGNSQRAIAGVKVPYSSGCIRHGPDPATPDPRARIPGRNRSRDPPFPTGQL
ncbi:unnamed protein product, partial [Iphiclides podalirius]